VIIVYASAIACGHKDRDDRPPQPAAAPPGLVPEATVAASCAKLVPQALVEKHLAGFAFDAGASSGLTGAPGPGTLCVYKKAGPPETERVSSSISFAPGDASENTAKLDAMVKNGGAHEVAGIGRRAVRVANTIEFASTRTSCVVALPANEEFAKALDAALAPGTGDCASAP
jgi:hypothetical protein